MPYALAPWKEGLFEEFEREYGYSVLPYLPQIFEGRQNAYTTRIHFYDLIGKIIARSYVKQISDWCHDHVGKFSGHYLAEEALTHHVLYYGSYLAVLKATDYPGVDVLAAYPRIFNYNTTRFAQMAARKRGTNGLMVELCPFIDIPHFEKEPVRYATGILNLLYLGGCRCINSYFSSDFASYSPDILNNYKGYMNAEQSSWLNNYVGRLGYMLEQTQNDCGTFVYYALEDVQAKNRPKHCAQESKDCATDRSILSLTHLIYEQGHDYLFADREDLLEAVENLAGGNAYISGIQVKNIILPSMDVIWQDAWDSLIKLKKAGVNVWFTDQLPAYKAEQRPQFECYDFREEAVCGPKCRKDFFFCSMSEEEILNMLNSQKQELTLYATAVNKTEDMAVGEKAQEIMLIRARFTKDGKIIYLIVNNFETDAEVSWNFEGRDSVEIWDPSDGTVNMVKAGEKVKFVSYRGKFLVFNTIPK